MELSPQFADNLLSIFKLNYASSIIDKMAASVSPSNVQIIAKIARYSAESTKHLVEVFGNDTWGMNKEIRTWLDIAGQYFQMMTLWAIHTTNEYEKQKLINTPKTIDTIYYEDMLIGNRLIQFRKEFQARVKGLSQYEDFNFKQCCLHAAAFVTETMASRLQE